MSYFLENEVLKISLVDKIIKQRSTHKDRNIVI